MGGESKRPRSKHLLACFLRKTGHRCGTWKDSMSPNYQVLERDGNIWSLL